jgi:hypothetical protein
MLVSLDVEGCALNQLCRMTYFDGVGSSNKYRTMPRDLKIQSAKIVR